MYTKAKKTISHVTPQRPLTEQEKQARIIQFLQQKLLVMQPYKNIYQHMKYREPLILFS